MDNTETLWICDNGCGAEIDNELITEVHSPDDSVAMLVCPSCVFDEWLSEWSVPFAPDPR